MEGYGRQTRRIEETLLETQTDHGSFSREIQRHLRDALDKSQKKLQEFDKLSRPNTSSPSQPHVPLDGPTATAVDSEAELNRLVLSRNPREDEAKFIATDVFGSCSSARSL